MSRQWIMRGLVGAVALQVGVLAAEYLNSIYPLWTGQEIRLKTIPVDPRSMFRGNYVRLNYEISTINIPQQTDLAAPRQGEVVYVTLQPGDDDRHVSTSASFTQPDKGLYIRGRIQQPGWESGTQPYQVRYGIEAFFAPREKALELEQQLRDGGVALVMLADNGKAVLKDVIGE
jgi:uncharacterized membrane-anchored protein